MEISARIVTVAASIFMFMFSKMNWEKAIIGLKVVAGFGAIPAIATIIFVGQFRNGGLI